MAEAALSEMAAEAGVAVPESPNRKRRGDELYESVGSPGLDMLQEEIDGDFDAATDRMIARWLPRKK